MTNDADESSKKLAAYWAGSITGTMATLGNFKRVISDRDGVRVTQVGEPLSRIPIQHSCGHFELRLTRWHGNAQGKAQGFIPAGSPCSQCAPQGRNVVPHFDTLKEARAAI
jgi:hypothetical protein